MCGGLSEVLTTQSYRNSDAGTQLLFLSYVRPYKPVTSQRMAHWIKDIGYEAGVGTRVHSVWGASVSTAMSKGVSLCDIPNMAD